MISGVHSWRRCIKKEKKLTIRGPKTMLIQGDPELIVMARHRIQLWTILPCSLVIKKRIGDC